MSEPGQGICPLCNADVWRFYTSGAADRLTMFDECDDGSWMTLGEAATYVAPLHGWLRPHNCLQDAA